MTACLRWGTSLMFVCTAAAAPFVAVDAEGRRHGPFELRNGAELALAGQTFTVEGVPETPEDAAALYRRFYRVNGTMPEDIIRCFSSTPEEPVDYGKFFGDLGIEWPAGASIRYLPGLHSFEFVNTLENHRRFTDLLAFCDRPPFQVEVECLFVAVPKTIVELAAREGRVSPAILLQAVREGQTQLLAAPKVVTKNGSEATIKAVVEYAYPTEFKVSPGETNANARTLSATVQPGGIETREVGVILQVVPDVYPELGERINLTLAPQVVHPPRWKDYAVSDAAGNTPSGAARSAPMELPFFPVDSLATSVQVRSGRTVVLGGGGASADGQSLVYVLLTATLVDAEGQNAPAPLAVNPLVPVKAPGS